MSERMAKRMKTTEARELYEEAAGSGEEKVCSGGCEGPNSAYVKLISSDDHEFIMKREYVLMSKTLGYMLCGPTAVAENETNDIHLTLISSSVLQIVCLYLKYKADCDFNPATAQFPSIDIPVELSFDVLMAANFLQL